MSSLRGNHKRRPASRKHSSKVNTNVTNNRLHSVPFLDSTQKRPVLITGGAGFIGTNLADRLMSSGHPVLVFDNLARRGSEINLEWLAGKHGSLLRVELGDVRDFAAVQSAVRQAAAVFHFAAQVAVTDSIASPRTDFDINAGGTLNVLEAIRASQHRPPLLFTSTNKVYGAMPDLALTKGADGYAPIDSKTATRGIGESRPLAFCSPYGCSKGTADQYVLDYAHTFGLCSSVFRMSCIYGPHQFGTEDQGWVAHFLLQAREGKTITIYGDGSQVRDVLYVDDLVDAFLLALQSIAKIRGQAFNIGGGAANTLNLLQLIQQITELQGCSCPVRFDHWRTGDQRYYVSDTHEFRKATGWTPKVGVRGGVSMLHRWLEDCARKEQSAEQRETEAIQFPRIEGNTGQDAFIRTS
jgi:CDP-paratose 2-epimerase